MTCTYWMDRLIELGEEAFVERFQSLLPSKAKELAQKRASDINLEYQELGLKNWRGLSSKEYKRMTHLQDLADNYRGLIREMR